MVTRKGSIICNYMAYYAKKVVGKFTNFIAKSTDEEGPKENV